MDFSRQDSISQKQCWVCYATELDEPTALWVKPCRCRGSTKWVHRSCLQSWIDEKQKGDPSKTVNCPQCNTKYIIVYPKYGIFTDLLAGVDRAATIVSPFVVVSGVVFSIYWSLTTYGGCVVVVVMGTKPASRVLAKVPSRYLYLGLPLIPVALMFSKRIRWQEWVLRFLHRHVLKPVKGAWPRAIVGEDAQRLPGEGQSSASITTSRIGAASRSIEDEASNRHSVRGNDAGDRGETSGITHEQLAQLVEDNDYPLLDDTPPPLEDIDGEVSAPTLEVGEGANNGQAQPQDGEQAAEANNLMVNIDVVIDRKSFLRAIASALTLPYFARLVGEILCPNVTPTWYRSLLGGTAYIFGKGIFGIYYKHQKVLRQALREVKDFPEEASQTTQTFFPDSETEEVASSDGVDFDITLMAEI